MSDTPVSEHRRRAPDELGFAILTVSDTRTLEDDPSGDRIAALVQGAGHRVEERLHAPDRVGAIRSALRSLLRLDGVDVVVVNGGTGVAPRDVTPEAIRPLMEKELPGFGELFRALSYEEIGAASLMTRAIAGIARSRAVFVLPGSTGGVTLAMERLVLPEAGHVVEQVRQRP